MVSIDLDASMSDLCVPLSSQTGPRLLFEVRLYRCWLSAEWDFYAQFLFEQPRPYLRFKQRNHSISQVHDFVVCPHVEGMSREERSKQFMKGPTELESFLIQLAIHILRIAFPLHLPRQEGHPLS
jgi:hypothetical protein